MARAPAGRARPRWRRRLRTTISALVAALMLFAAWFVTYLPGGTARPATFDDSARPRVPVPSGGYGGPLYLTSEKVGWSAPFAQIVRNMDRNGVAAMVAYVSVEESAVFRRRAIRSAANVGRRFPGRFTFFYSTGKGGKGEGLMAGEPLTAGYREGYEIATGRYGRGFYRGIGEIELMRWLRDRRARTWPGEQRGNEPAPNLTLDLDAEEVTSLMRFADGADLDVMIHVAPGRQDQVAALAQRFPRTTFIQHLYPNELNGGGTAPLLEAMRAAPNLTYTIDADHLLFTRDPRTKRPLGLGFNDRETPPQEAIRRAVSTFDEHEELLFAAAVERFAPIVRAFPDRVTIGTEMSPAWNFDERVYDRTMRFIRRFIGAMAAEHRDAIAWRNALRIFGHPVAVS